MENVVRKLHAEFHPASLIRERFRIGGNKNLTKKQKILFPKFFEMRFSATYSY